jgi:hypothetical protein
MNSIIRLFNTPLDVKMYFSDFPEWKSDSRKARHGFEIWGAWKHIE